MKLVIDLMGGDNGEKATIPAVIKFAKKYGDDCFIYAVGDRKIKEQFNGINNICFVESLEVLKMDIDPMSAYRSEKSSLMIAVNTYLSNNCDILISAGSSGALLTASIFKIKRIEGIIRPCFISSFPTLIENKYVVVCDLGANNSNTKEELVQFAKLGSIYYDLMYSKNRPEVYLLSNGTEDDKGSPLTKETFKLLKDEKSINFIGNTEGRDALEGKIDVIVCDGFSGNVFLKATEGAVKSMSTLMKKMFSRNIFSKIGYLFERKGVKELKKRMDYKNVGGALLIGVNGIIVKAHGNSDDQSFYSALEVARKLKSMDVISKIKSNLK